MIDTSITDIAFEDAQMERRRPRPRASQTCETCAHYGCCEDLHHCGGRYWKEAEDAKYLSQIADCIEASRRETPGNAAAMREALENSNGLLEELAEIGEWGESAREQIAENNAALSAPARNCDVFNCVESARQAWLDDADNWNDFGSPKLELHEWLYAPAKRKGEDDGR